MALARAASLLALVGLASVAGLLAVPAAATGKTGQVTMFWGRNKAEGSLGEACDTGMYSTVIISFLNVFGYGSKYGLDLSGHPINGIGDDIKHCQSKNILVFLSIGGFGGQYSLPTSQSAANLAQYLWNAYLAGSRAGVRRPFGSAAVNGIDFFIDQGATEHYDELARRLWNYNKGFRGRTPVQLTATPRCAFPYQRLEQALDTGLFGRVHVRFYGDSHCATDWEQEWDKWTEAYPNSQIYVGLPASEQTVGYVDPNNLENGVVPVVQEAANYGGIMIWDRYDDRRTNYSGYAIEWA